MSKRKDEIRSIMPLHEYIEEEFMQDGRAVIHVRLYPGLEIFQPLSVGHQMELHPDIIEYIDHRAAIIPSMLPITIRFHASCLTDDQKQRIRDCLTEHYTVVMHDIKWDKRINRRKIIALAAIGLTVLGFYITMNLNGASEMKVELASILASFTLWEAVDLFLLERTEINKNLWNTAQQLTQNIEFVDDEETSGGAEQ